MTSSSLDLQEALIFARECAREAGALAIERRAGLRATRKADRSLVTDVDMAIQNLLTERITQRYPGHGVMAEESSGGPTVGAESDYWWVIDPLDGTRNFVKGFPIYCISIALLQAGQPVVGVVHDPVAARTYSATRDCGAYLNDEQLAVAEDSWNEDTLIGIPTGKHMELPSAIYGHWLKHAVLRNTGSTALHMAYVAAGALDACYGQKVKIWDVAAGALLVEEAGGAVTTPQGERLLPIDPVDYRGEDLAFLAGGKTMHAELLRTLRE